MIPEAHAICTHGNAHNNCAGCAGRAEVARLREYADHHVTCPAYDSGGECTCGFEALAATGGKP